MKPMAERLDRIDRKIVAELQADATVSIAVLAERVGLTPTSCWKRIQKLEQSGVILGRVAIVDPSMVGLHLTVFTEIELSDHRSETRDALVVFLEGSPEVVEVFRMAGDVDYLLKVLVSDTGAFDDFYRRLTNDIPLRNVSSHIVMESLKVSTTFPIDTTTR